MTTSATPERVCTACVMDTTDAAITFDADGVCDHCRMFRAQVLPAWDTGPRGRAALERLVERIKAEGKGRDFDCIMGMSGGIDSSFLCHVAKAEFGLRPLVFHVDAGWNTQQAVNNIEKLVDGLGLDLYTEVIDWPEMRDLQLAFFKAGVPHLDVPQDHAFFATMYNFAAKYRIRTILTGANFSTECVRNPTEWMYFATDVRQIRDIHGRFGTRPLRNFPLSNILRHKVWLRYGRGIKVLRPLNHVPYHKERAMDLLVERYGWQRYPQKHFESRFTRFYEGFWLPRRFGYDTRKVQYSSLILTGQMTRAEALERLRLPAYDEATIAHDFEYVATKLGITVAELQGYLDMPRRTHRDFASQRHTFAVGARVMRWLGLERGGKR